MGYKFRARKPGGSWSNWLDWHNNAASVALHQSAIGYGGGLRELPAQELPAQTFDSVMAIDLTQPIRPPALRYEVNDDYIRSPDVPFDLGIVAE